MTRKAWQGECPVLQVPKLLGLVLKRQCQASTINLDLGMVRYAMRSYQKREERTENVG